MKKKSAKSFNDKKLIAVTIIAFFVFAFLVGFVNVGGEATVTGHATSFISDLFTSWSAGNLDVNIAKYLLFIMLTLLIYSIFAASKFPKKSPVRFLLALPIAFLATAYLTPKEVFSILTAYSALGLTLTILVPFIIMLLFSGALLSTEKIRQLTLGKIMLEVVLWLFFVVFLIYKLIFGFTTGEVSFGVNFTTLTMVVILFFSVLIFFFNRKFRAWVWKVVREIKSAKAEAERDLREEERRAREAAERE